MIEVMKQALEALQRCEGRSKADEGDRHRAITFLRQAIEQAEKQEPVTYPDGYVVGPCICGSWPGGKCLKCPRITPQPQREWVGLTDEEMRDLEKQFEAERVRTSDEEYLVIYPAAYWQWQRAIEAKLKEKNT